MLKAVGVLFALVLVVGGGYWYTQVTQKPLPSADEPEPTDFAECARLYPVNRSLPRTCTTRTGTLFTEDLGNQLEVRAYVSVSTPRPNDTISSPIHIKGEARGDWYSDDVLIPVEIRSANGEVIGHGTVETKQFTGSLKMQAFEGTVSFETPRFGHSGTVVLYNKNNTRDRLVIPVGFK